MRCSPRERRSESGHPAWSADRDPRRRPAGPHDCQRWRHSRSGYGRARCSIPTRIARRSAVADEVIVGAFDDPVGAEKLARMSAVVTYEIEQIGQAALAAAERYAPVRPSPAVLSIVFRIGSNRSNGCRSTGFRSAPFATRPAWPRWRRRRERWAARGSSRGAEATTDGRQA